MQRTANRALRPTLVVFWRPTWVLRATADGRLAAAEGPIRLADGVTLEQLGSLGEFIAAIATLATLIYLAIQIRQNTGAVRTATAQAILGNLTTAIQAAASSPELSRVVLVGQSDYEQLSEVERAQWIVWLTGWCRIVEQAYHSHLLGHLDARDWNGHLKQMESIVQAPAFARWWKVRHPLYSTEFQKLIEDLSEHASVPPTTELANAMLNDEPAA